MKRPRLLAECFSWRLCRWHTERRPGGPPGADDGLRRGDPHWHPKRHLPDARAGERGVPRAKLRAGNDDGNLYELNFFGGDPMSNPKGIPLKDELEDRRKRDDLIELAAIAKTVPDDFFSRRSRGPGRGPHPDLSGRGGGDEPRDAFSYHNNTYRYRVPATGRFVLIPHGADQSFGATGPTFALSSPYQPTRAVLTNRFRSVPALLEKYRAEVTRVSQPPVRGRGALLARVEQIARLLGAAERVGRTASKIACFEVSRPIIEAFIRRHGTTWTGNGL